MGIFCKYYKIWYSFFMQNLNLTTDEIANLDKYSFSIRRNFSWSNHIETVIYLLFLSAFSIIPWLFLWVIGFPMLSTFMNFDSNYSFFLSVIFFSGISIAYPLFQYTYFFVRSGITFFTVDKKLEYGAIHQIWDIRPKIFMEWLMERIASQTTFEEKMKLYFYGIFLPIGVPLLFLATLKHSGEYESYTLISTLFYGYLLFVLFLTVFTSLIRNLFQSFNPLYAFGNLWEKIQKLTPIIEAKSKEIQKNFEQDMNFSVLSDWFDSLSSTFSQIVSLVIKLEHVEKRANKWNLFDSEKYINSLRSDIVEPLKSLKVFLEKQREELLHSQKELQRVRVWGSDPEINSGWQGHRELSSKRSDLLLSELTENIEKVDRMIAKMN